MQTRSALILGAGIAGLACATALARAGLRVTLLDKGRRPGGRVATRRALDASFNHGAQYATARGPALAGLIETLRATGRAAPWPDATRFAFTPGMSALPATMAEHATAAGATLLLSRHAGFLHHGAAGWQARHFPADAMRPGAIAAEGGDLTAPHDLLLLALPAPQATPLLAAIAHPFGPAAAKATLAPCWTVMARFNDPVPGADTLRPQASAIGWAARESARPGAPQAPEAWTIQATAAWSRTHLEAAPETITAALLASFQSLTGATATTALAHRWRHAQVETPLGQPCLFDAPSQLGLCGDWCIGPRIEAAYESGLALAAQALAG